MTGACEALTVDLRNTVVDLEKTEHYEKKAVYSSQEFQFQI